MKQKYNRSRRAAYAMGVYAVHKLKRIAFPFAPPMYVRNNYYVEAIKRLKV